MKKTLYVMLVSFMILSGCRLFSPEAVPTETPYPDEVSWETAVEILNLGEVKTIMQLHNLDVTFTLANGTEIETVEPKIDEIFREVDRCGMPCSTILIATE